MAKVFHDITDEESPERQEAQRLARQFKVKAACGEVISAIHPNPIRHRMACRACQQVSTEQFRAIAGLPPIREKAEISDEMDGCYGANR